MELRTLGGLFLTEHEFRRSKPLLLLAFLCLEGPQPRRVLAETFWTGAADPRDSLTTTVRRLNGVSPGLVLAGRQSLRTEVDCDAKRLLALLDAGHYAEAVELYSGPFLHGIDLELTPELEDWVFDTRDYIARRVRGAHVALAESALADGDVESAGRHAEAAVRLADLAPLDGDELRRAHRALVAAHSPLAARVEAEAAELGLLLREEGVPSAESDLPAGPEHLPRPVSTFVGRQEELATLAALIADPYCRVVTLHGPGGIGKSRLALEAAWRCARQDEDLVTSFVELEEASSGAALVAELARRLGLHAPGESVTLQRVSAHIGRRRALLVLDNFDHLVAAAPLLSELTARCTNLTLLVTSRERLRLVEEHVLPLGGLSTTATGGATSEAVSLLVDRVRRNGGDDLLPHELESAHRIVELVGGSPLAIELVASWASALPLAEVAASLERGTDLLRSRDRNAPPRQRDLEAVFEESWRRLSEPERAIYARLGVFHGGFTVEAAAEVALCDRETLAAFVDRSLVSLSKRHRYQLHPLLRRASEQRLRADPSERARTLDRHARHYLELLAAAPSDAGGVELLDTEFDNVRAAWTRVVELRDWPLLERALPALAAYLERRARHSDGLQMLDTALKALGSEDDAPRIAEALAAHAAWLCHRQGDHARALALAEPLLTGTRGRALEAMLLAHKAAAASRFRIGAYDAATEACEDAMALARAAGHDLAEPEILEVLGMTRCEEGRFDDSRRLLSQALVHYRARGDLYGVAGALGQLANVYLNLKQPEDARPLLTEALRVARETGAEALVPQLSYGLGVAALELGDFPGAREMLSRALFSARRDGDASRQAAALSVLFRTAAKEGDVTAAKRYLKEGLTIALEIGEAPRALKFLVYLAEALLAAGDDVRLAERLLRFALSQPEVAHWARELAQDLLAGRSQAARSRTVQLHSRNGAGAVKTAAHGASYGSPVATMRAEAEFATLEEAAAVALEYAGV